MNRRRVIVVGAGMGGLAAAADLARQDCDVTVVERAAAPGGKLREVRVGGAPIDAGPTVFTMRWIFEALFADAGSRLEDHLALEPLSILARHAWTTGGRLDLYADPQRSAEAIGTFSGARDARGYLDFCARSRDIYLTLRDSFIAAQRPTPVGLVRRVGLAHLDAMWRTAPLRTLWSALGDHFTDPRLRQLFGRYATYVGSSPLATPATLMLVAHVEQDGVWQVRGGMRRIADALQALGAAQGAQYRFGAHVERILTSAGRVSGVELADGTALPADAVVFNGDASALGQGLLGPAVQAAARATAVADRSLSAITWCVRGRPEGFPLTHHNVFFAADYPAEFDHVFRRRGICREPTVYLCAQDRADAGADAGVPERMLLLINAPADGDHAPPDAAMLARCAGDASALLARCGLTIHAEDPQRVATTPAGFNALFPGTGGALYGRANHGSMASFARPGARSRIPGLYLAGGSVHPGPGIPMALMSGRLAAASVIGDATRVR
jgi:1-hydroxycarotenoid 3,4-desaturase